MIWGLFDKKKPGASQGESKGLFDGLRKSSAKLADGFTSVFTKEKLDAGDIASLEEVLIASDIQWVLSQAGYEVAEIRTTVSDALESIARARFDIAILDANLNGESAEPVAAELSRRQDQH